MTREQIEAKAKEIALDAVNRGFAGTESYCAAMEMADFILSHQWISVRDKMPKDKQDVFINVGEIDGDDCLFECVTHWMPILQINNN